MAWMKGEYIDWGEIGDAAADNKLRREMTPDKPTCPVCQADLAGGEEHADWCTQ